MARIAWFALYCSPFVNNDVRSIMQERGVLVKAIKINSALLLADADRIATLLEKLKTARKRIKSRIIFASKSRGKSYEQPRS